MTDALIFGELNPDHGSLVCEEAEAGAAGWALVREGDEWIARLKFSLWFHG